MKAAPIWPKHLYLIASGNAIEHHEPTIENMGSKAFNLLHMARIGLTVSPALVVGTHYTRHPDECMLPVFSVGLPALQEVAGLVFGDERRPLIVSVRSGAPVSMPGMMETLLNIGLCESTIPGLLRRTGNPRLVWDAYRRLIASYGEVVAQLPASLFEEALEGVTQGRDERLLDFSELRTLARRFLSIYQQNAGTAFPQDVNEQLSGAVRSVFASWQADRATQYRKINQIDPAIGTAVTIQCMVFGNSGGNSGAGVGFTRDPTSGEPHMWVDYLANAQGDDVVSGRRNALGHQALASIAPQAWSGLERATRILESEFKDMQDFEFTVQEGVLYMLQTRPGKRTALAAARIALDLMDEGVIDGLQANQRTVTLSEEEIGTVRLARLGTEQQGADSVAQAVSACLGVACGEIVLDGQIALSRASAGASVILVRQDAETHDIAAIEVAVGLLTQRGARTSHAAVVARQLGRVCLVACEGLQIDVEARQVRFGELLMNEGDLITLDGNQGRVYAGSLAAVMVPDEALIERLRQLRASVIKGKSGQRRR
jgi:pyruvate,orthophosphate dikinase